MSFFLKPSVAVRPPEVTIPNPAFSGELGYARELAAVVGTECRDVAREEASDVVRGYTTDVVMNDLDVETHIDGERRQRANAGEMNHPPSEVIAFLSRRFRFRPGDVVAFGSPPTPAPSSPGA